MIFPYNFNKSIYTYTPKRHNITNYQTFIKRFIYTTHSLCIHYLYTISPIRAPNRNSFPQKEGAFLSNETSVEKSKSAVGKFKSAVGKFKSSCHPKVASYLPHRLCPEQSGAFLRPNLHFPTDKLPLSYRETTTFLPRNYHFPTDKLPLSYQETALISRKVDS